MNKLTIFDDNNDCHMCYVTEGETPNQILQHYGFNPDTKIVYLNGQILSRAKMDEPIKFTGRVFMSIKNKTVMR